MIGRGRKDVQHACMGVPSGYAADRSIRSRPAQPAELGVRGAPYAPFDSSFVQESRSVTMRLKTGRAGVESTLSCQK